MDNAGLMSLYLSSFRPFRVILELHPDDYLQILKTVYLSILYNQIKYGRPYCTRKDIEGRYTDWREQTVRDSRGK